MNNIIPKDKSEDYIFERKKNEDINNQFIKEKRNIPKKDIESKDKDDRNNKLNNLKINDFSLSFIGQNSKKIFRALKEQNQQNFSIFPNEDDESVDVSNNEENEFNYLSNIKPKGLKNLGSCCYMNATLQCFYHIKELTNYFLKNKKEIKKKDGLLSNGLLDVIEGLSNNNSYTYYIPQTFKDNLLEVDDVFEGFEGKDSGDLVQTILLTIQDELGGEIELPDFSIDQRDESAMFIDLYVKNNLSKSIITDLFNFYIRIQNRCCHCGNCFYSLSSENYLMFDLKQVYSINELNKVNNNRNNTYRSVSIDNCLACYSFDGANNENAECKICKKNGYIFSVRSFITLPKYLIMVMSRGEAEKFECHVEIKEEIDLNDSFKEIKGMPKERNTKYNLIAGTILHGSGGYGHTVAFCKHFDEKFYIFNDSSCFLTNLDYIKKQKIYLLFYKKKID